MEMREPVIRFDLDSSLKILNRILVVAHVLVDEPALNVDSFVVWQQLLHLCELLEGLVEFLRASVHQAQVEHR